MANILLLEPSYKNKYPPLGLMKIAAFHKYTLHDYVYFSKGELRGDLRNKKWDKVYVTTLFTFEWKKTIEMINYAKTLVPIESIEVGGIASSLMPNEFKKETGITPTEGLLNVPGKLGYSGDECIDTITPDYSILDDIADYYHYPYENAYFMYSTRGCGMNCGFCAVKTLEPSYVPFISIKEQILAINRLYGPKKDLLLMDNNVLKSQKLEKIISELLELGFENGAMFQNPKTKKNVNRYVDFNQGLDAYLLTKEKAELLSRIALKPARVAFDHIEDTNTYKKAIWNCAYAGIKTLSNYVLFNAEEFSGKGHTYEADGPLELYRRLELNIQLVKDINTNRDETDKITIFSFPMRYIPLNDKERGYIASKWNAKYLRAVQVVLIPTQGKVGTSASFFYTAFGKNEKEFLEILDMSEYVIVQRGAYIEKANLSKEENNIREQNSKNKMEIVHEWQRLYYKLSSNPILFNQFHDIIYTNKFKKEDILECNNTTISLILLFYISANEFKELFESLQIPKYKEKLKLIVDYCLNFPPILDRFIDHWLSSNIDRHQKYLSIFNYLAPTIIIQILQKSTQEKVIHYFKVNNLLQ